MNTMPGNDTVALPAHRAAGLLAAHPGEKRLVERAIALCPRLPEGMATDVAAVLAAAGVVAPETLIHLTRLLDRLDEGLDRALAAN